MTSWTRRLADAFRASGLAVLLRALRHPRRFGASAARIGALANEFARGGVVVESRGYCTTLQADGDLQLRVFDTFRACPPECRAEALETHFRTLADRLRPLAEAAEAAALARAVLGSLAGLNGIATETARALSDEPASLTFWLPHILTAGLVLGAASARRLIWWLIRLWFRGVESG